MAAAAATMIMENFIVLLERLGRWLGVGEGSDEALQVTQLVLRGVHSEVLWKLAECSVYIRFLLSGKTHRQR